MYKYLGRHSQPCQGRRCDGRGVGSRIGPSGRRRPTTTSFCPWPITVTATIISACNNNRNTHTTLIDQRILRPCRPQKRYPIFPPTAWPSHSLLTSPSPIIAFRHHARRTACIARLQMTSHSYYQQIRCSFNGRASPRTKHPRHRLFPTSDRGTSFSI